MKGLSPLEDEQNEVKSALIATRNNSCRRDQTATAKNRRYPDDASDIPSLFTPTPRAP